MTTLGVGEWRHQSDIAVLTEQYRSTGEDFRQINARPECTRPMDHWSDADDGRSFRLDVGFRKMTGPCRKEGGSSPTLKGGASSNGNH